MRQFVGYYRVSTQSQHRSALGLKAQVESVARYVRSVSGELLADFEEVESGGSSSRMQLAAALRLCRTRRATLVIAKLDRLSRNMSFIAQLMESGVDFVAADMPSANKLTIHIIAAMAEYERDLISQRTKEALAAAKRRGTILGNPQLGIAAVRGTASRVAAADQFAARLAPTINAMKANGVTSYSGIARSLNALGVRTSRGKDWTAMAVRSLELRSRREPKHVGLL